ncbi:MAG TPA: hypothetical protein G4O01_06955 [Dehalococcoidia bacterium]|nr:hypothetical protein [Dehalococcoidia bacterium]
MVEGKGSRLLYREVQYFRQLWIWALVLASSLISIWGVVWQIILGRPFGDNPAPDVVLIIIAVVIGLGLPIFFYVANLTTEVRDDGVYFRFFPLHLSFRRIGLEDISGFAAQTYRPIRDYGGWGIRYGRGGKAYNVSGNRGVQLELANGGRILLGSQHPEEMAEAVGAALGRRRS